MSESVIYMFSGLLGRITWRLNGCHERKYRHLQGSTALIKEKKKELGEDLSRFKQGARTSINGPFGLCGGLSSTERQFLVSTVKEEGRVSLCEATAACSGVVFPSSVTLILFHHLFFCQSHLLPPFPFMRHFCLSLYLSASLVPSCLRVLSAIGFWMLDGELKSETPNTMLT